MSAILRKHRARRDDEDAELEETLIDEMESMDTDSDPGSDTATDPRWDELKKLTDNK